MKSAHIKKRIILLIIVTSVFLSFLISCASITADNAALEVEVTESMLHTPIKKGDIPLFASIYREVSDSEIRFLAAHYDRIFIIDTLCKKSLVNKLRAVTPDIKILMITNPYFPQAYFGPLKDKWKAKTNEGKFIYSTYGGSEVYKIHIMNFSDKDWLKFYIRQTKKRVEDSGVDGALIDTLTNSPPYPFWATGLHAGYSVELWQATCNYLISELKKALGKAEIIYNGIVSESDKKLQNLEYLDITNGAAMETFGLGVFTLDDGINYRSWFLNHSILKLMKKVVDKNKYLFLEIRAGRESARSQLFALSSFLLLRTDKTFFYAASKKNDETIIWFPEWSKKLGKPAGPYTVKNELYQRRYEKGLVLVNGNYLLPQKAQLDKAYFTLNGEKVDSLWVGKLYGTILLDDAL